MFDANLMKNPCSQNLVLYQGALYGDCLAQTVKKDD